MSADVATIREFVHTKIREAAQANWQPVPTLDDNFNLIESGLFDSLGFVELLAAVEKQFEISIDPAEDLTILGNLIRAAADAASNPA
jgi:acyl carrier protein